MHDNNALKDSKRNQDYNKELDILTQYFNSEIDFFKKNAKKAEMMLKIGEFKQKTIKDKNLTAALMQTIQMIFNMEEAIVRG
jgi:predicted membrane chloride channel (bestrophin family)